jgi:hypothetical protein
MRIVIGQSEVSKRSCAVAASSGSTKVSSTRNAGRKTGYHFGAKNARASVSNKRKRVREYISDTKIVIG